MFFEWKRNNKTFLIWKIIEKTYYALILKFLKKNYGYKIKRSNPKLNYKILFN